MRGFFCAYSALNLPEEETFYSPILPRVIARYEAISVCANQNRRNIWCGNPHNQSFYVTVCCIDCFTTVRNDG
jgi:hypothetical protein